MSNRANLDDWHDRLFEVSKAFLLRRDEARRQIEVDRLVDSQIAVNLKQQQDWFKGPEIKNVSVGK